MGSSDSALVHTRGQATTDMPSVEITPRRNEVKIPLPSLLLADVEAWVRVHPFHWRRPHPPRQINNIYFDTPTYTGLNANLAGIGERAKLRLRWYGDQLTCVADAHLELKQKRGTIGWKEVIPISVNLGLRDTGWRQLTAALEDAAGSKGRCWFSHFPIPVLINCYRRDYYDTPDGVVRLTVDRRLRAYGQRATRVPNLTLLAPLEDEIVIELKAPTDAGALRRLNDALSYFPPSVGRFSKYVQGMLAAPDFP